MVEAEQAFSLPAAGRLLAYRLAIPAVALCLYAALAVLWRSGAHSIYFGALHFLVSNRSTLRFSTPTPFFPQRNVPGTAWTFIFRTLATRSGARTSIRRFG
jgi:hypothetical protein